MTRLLFLCDLPCECGRCAGQDWTEDVKAKKFVNTAIDGDETIHLQLVHGDKARMSGDLAMTVVSYRLIQRSKEKRTLLNDERLFHRSGPISIYQISPSLESVLFSRIYPFHESENVGLIIQVSVKGVHLRWLQKFL